jgi:hypothetical protein
MGFDLKMPVVSPKGPYFWSQELIVMVKDAPPRHCHYLIVQTYSNSDFQLQKAWRSDEAGKLVEDYPIAPAPVMADARRVFLGPANLGAERGWSSWYSGTLGAASVGIGADDPATGLNCFTIGVNDVVPGTTNHADIKSEVFPLGPSAKGRLPIMLSFAYKLPGKVKAGDNVQMFFRFFDRATNFLDQQMILIGSKTADSEMTAYKTMTLANIFAPVKAAVADIWITANVFDAPWSSGIAQFDDFSVTVNSPRSRTGTFAGIGAFAALAVLLTWAWFARHRRN